ncbi:MAG: hypothetical protein ACM3JP_01350 [Betaproteobacteria bacterium]
MDGRVATNVGYRAAFDRLFARGSEAVLAGSHYRDTPPVAGGRWGVSVVFRPDPGCVERLAALTDEALTLAGPGHWPTGAPQSVHVTVRAMEAHRPHVTADDPLVRRCAAALHRTAAACGPVRFHFRGLTLTPSGVMLCAYPTDSAADRVAGRLAHELGGDAWFEAEFHRDIWYATLVHFTGVVADPAGLVDWVASRRDLDLGVSDIDGMELTRFTYNGLQPVRSTLARAHLDGVHPSRE